MAKRPLPSPEVLRQLLSYDRETGFLHWLERDTRWFSGTATRTREHSCNLWNACYKGKRAFTAINGTGYYTGAVLGCPLKGHRVAWAIETGEWPVNQIDHIDHDRANNRWANLREVTNTQNRMNMKRYATNTSGYSGVQPAGSRWSASITLNGKGYHLGHFLTVEEAVEARMKAEIKMGFHPNHGQ